MATRSRVVVLNGASSAGKTTIATGFRDHLTRRIPELITEAGFTITQLDAFYEKGSLKFLAADSLGVASEEGTQGYRHSRLPMGDRQRAHSCRSVVVGQFGVRGMVRVRQEGSDPAPDSSAAFRGWTRKAEAPVLAFGSLPLSVLAGQVSCQSVEHTRLLWTRVAKSGGG